jgi:vacuolar protein sorting-associated protein 13A/C
VTGVFTTPVKEAKKGGIGGFFKGIGKGAVGLVAKPAESVVDLVSKTTEGLEH